MSEVEIVPSSLDEATKEKFTRGTKTLLQGVPGSGKTTSLITFIEAGLDVFVAGTEPGFEESLIDAVMKKGLDINKLHYHYIIPTVTDFAAIRATAQRANTMSYGDIGTMKNGIDKHRYQQFFELLDCMANFVDDRTGEEFGAVDEWPADRVFALDSLTGLNKMVRGLHLGGKPTPHEGEWNIIMQIEEDFINTLISNCKCFVVLTAHVTKGANPLTGIPTIAVDALGAKLGPRLPALFSDVPMAMREGDNFYWSTSQSNADLKNRALPIKEKLQPSFVQIVEVWKKRCEAIKALSK